MTDSPLTVFLRRVAAAPGPADGGPTDGELLARFLGRRDGDALSALVGRHAPMVWAVCRRVLRDPADAEDAFQATFLVLVRKAATIVPRDLAGNWLHGVARRTALRVRASAARRSRREVRGADSPEPAAPAAEAGDGDLLLLLDEELGRLPERPRALLVLCDLEGRTRRDVARHLGCPEGTVASGLARARALLARRMARHGPAGSVAAVLASVSQPAASAGVPAAVVASAVKLANLFAAGKAAGAVSCSVESLTHGVLKAMLLKKITTTAAALALGVAAVAAGGLVMGQTAGPGKPSGGPGVTPPTGTPAEPAGHEQSPAGKRTFTAWGKAVGGVQAGLGFPAGARRAYRHGETVTLVVRVRNAGEQGVKFRYFNEWFYETPPAVVGGDGKPVSLKGVFFTGERRPVDVTLAPGEEVELTELRFTLRAGRGAGGDWPWTLSAAGKYLVRVEEMGGNVRSVEGSPDPVLSKLATGTLELEVRDAAGERPKALSPDAAIRAAGDPRLAKEFNDGKPPVEFKVESVTEPVRAVVWANGHEPGETRLHPAPQPHPSQTRFVAVLTERAAGQFRRAGVSDAAKHLKGRTVRVSGPISATKHRLYGTPGEVQIVVDDLAQIEVMD